MASKPDKLYLVGITGRTSFILENLAGRKVKVTVGNELRCSQCGKGRQCPHIRHALMEIFYLPPDSSLLQKDAFSDQELRTVIASRRVQESRVEGFLRFVQKREIIEEADSEDEDERSCAICRMQIVRCDATSVCTDGCSNAFHLECFAQWARHETQEGRPVRCPLCRNERAKHIIRELRIHECQHRHELNNRKVLREFHYYCDGCQLRELSPAEPVYRCVGCEDVTLCDTCFKRDEHTAHSFVVKQPGELRWREAEDRRSKRKLDGCLNLVRLKPPSSHKLANFLAGTLPCFLRKNTRSNIIECKKRDLKLMELTCVQCADSQKAFLRRLPCGHFIHHRCLRKRIEKARFHCRVDGHKYLLGYAALLRHEQLNRKIEENEREESEEDEEEEREEIRSPSRKKRSPAPHAGGLGATSCDSRRLRSPPRNQR